MQQFSNHEIKTACLAVANTGNRILAVKLCRLLMTHQVEPSIHAGVETLNKWMAEPADAEPSDDNNLGGILKAALKRPAA